ncbi:MAG: hypothetical protein ACREBG_09170 [Pyrinomonadaceae bacterium]
MDSRAILTPLNMVVSVVMYFPLFKRILMRRRTGDFSISTQVCIVLLQVSSLVLAILEGAYFLTSYYVLQVGLTALLLWLIFRYRGG